MNIQFQKKVQLQVPASVAMLYALCLVIPMVLRLIGSVLHGCYLMLDNGGSGGLSMDDGGSGRRGGADEACAGWEAFF